MTAKIHFLDDVRSEDQVFQAELWTTWNRLNTPEGTREWEEKTRAYAESIRTPLPMGISIGLVPFANHRIWCVLITSDVTSVRFLMEEGPESGPLSTEQIDTTVFYDGDLESALVRYREVCQQYTTLPDEVNPLTAVRLMRGLRRTNTQPGDEIGINRVVATVRKTEEAICALTQVALQSRTGSPVVEV
jgi:hypothetical protein